MPGFTVAHLRADGDRMPRRHANPRYPYAPLPPPPGATAAVAAAPWAGRIRFLPPKRDITVDCSSIALDEEGYKHPVVILSSSIPHDRKVEVLMITSFTERDLQVRFPEPHKRHLWADYLPIHPSKPHPTDGLILELAPGCEPLRKDSYVNISRRLTIPIDATTWYTWRHDATVLSPASFKILAERCGYAATLPAALPPSPPLSPTEEDLVAMICRAHGFPTTTPRRISEPSSSSLPRTRPPAVAAMTEPPAYSYPSRISGQRQPQRTPRPSASSHTHHDQRYCPSSLPDAYQSDSRNARSNERTSLRGSSNNAARLNYGAMSRPVWPSSPSPPRGPSAWARLGHCLLRAVEGTAMWFWWRKEYILAWAALMLVFFGTGWCVVKGCQLVKAGWDWVAAGVSGAAEGVVRWIKDVLGVRI